MQNLTKFDIDGDEHRRCGVSWMPDPQMHSGDLGRSCGPTTAYFQHPEGRQYFIMFTEECERHTRTAQQLGWAQEQLRKIEEKRAKRRKERAERGK